MSFAAVQAKIAGKEGISGKAAGAILASSTRKASPAAKKANPNLLKVKGKPKGPPPMHKRMSDAMLDDNY